MPFLGFSFVLVYQSLVHQTPTSESTLRRNTADRRDANLVLQHNTIRSSTNPSLYRTLGGSAPFSQLSPSQAKKNNDQIGDSMQFQVRCSNKIDKETAGSPKYSLLVSGSAASEIYSPTMREKNDMEFDAMVMSPSQPQMKGRVDSRNNAMEEEVEAKCLLMLPRQPDEIETTNKLCQYPSSFV